MTIAFLCILYFTYIKFYVGGNWKETEYLFVKLGNREIKM